MAYRWPSRVWSCSEVLRGAAAVVDMQRSRFANGIVDQQHDLMQQTRGLSAAELEAMLKDSFLRNAKLIP